MSNHTSKLVLFVFAVLLMSSCAPKPVSETPHWVYDQQIRGVMAQLATDVASSSSIRQGQLGTSYSQETRQAFDDAGTLAEALGESADTIECLVEERDMAEADRTAFLAQVNTLRRQARSMTKMAAGYNMQGVQLAFQEIDATCNSCHTRFRDYAGAIESTHD